MGSLVAEGDAMTGKVLSRLRIADMEIAHRTGSMMITCCSVTFFSASPRAAMHEPHQKRLYRSIRCRGGAAGRGELYAWLVPERVSAWR